MTDLRDLLIDLRIELRKLKPDFQKNPFRHRMDEAVSILGRLPDASLEAILAAGSRRAEAPAAAVATASPTPSARSVRDK
jgi:hypothetical protein